MIRSFLVSLTTLGLVASSAGAATYEIDSAHSGASFGDSHLVISTVRGTLGKVTGTVVIDENDVTQSTVEATIDVLAIDTREPKRDKHLLAEDFLDGANHPTITFKSKSAEKVSDTEYNVTGDLTLRGVTKEVVLNVKGSPTPIKDPWGNTKLGGVATTTINRQDFGVSFSKTLDGGGLVVGNEVDVTIDIELTQK